MIKIIKNIPMTFGDKISLSDVETYVNKLNTCSFTEPVCGGVYIQLCNVVHDSNVSALISFDNVLVYDMNMDNYYDHLNIYIKFDNYILKGLPPSMNQQFLQSSNSNLFRDNCIDHSLLI